MNINVNIPVVRAPGLDDGWKIGLCQCDGEDCLRVWIITYFCWCLQPAFQNAALESRECNIVDGILSCCLPWCCACKARMGIREKYGIPGNPIIDCLALWFCPFCAIAQQTQELRARGAKPAGIFMEM